jgi:hypothetical protein
MLKMVLHIRGLTKDVQWRKGGGDGVWPDSPCGTFRSIGSRSNSNGKVTESGERGEAEEIRARERALGQPTYSNGRGERSQPERGDLNVPLRLDCELVGGDRWSATMAG